MLDNDYRYSDEYDADFEIEKLRESKMEVRQNIHAKNPAAIEMMEAQLKRIWDLICEWDGIQADSIVVRFSASNPYRAELDRVICTMQEAGMRVDFRPGN